MGDSAQYRPARKLSLVEKLARRSSQTGFSRLQNPTVCAGVKLRLAILRHGVSTTAVKAVVAAGSLRRVNGAGAQSAGGRVNAQYHFTSSGPVKSQISAPSAR